MADARPDSGSGNAHTVRARRFQVTGDVHLLRVNANGPENREPDKCCELSSFSLSELPAQLTGYCRAAVDHIAAGERFSICGW